MAKAQLLQVGPDLVLPADVITQSVALLAVRRAGKSNAAAVMAEEMYAAGLPWVAIDPKGDWWGLRSSKDGTGPGLPIPIFGGLHGDMPLLPESGQLIAELIVEQNLTCVLDVSEFASKAAQMRFLTDLGERIFRLHGKHPQPRHIFLEEADEFIPQRVTANQARCVGAWTRLVKQGGSRGLGVTLISQRSAVVNKDALTQTETMIALRTTSPQDRKAILDWVSYHDVARELVDSLPGLDDGEAWVCSPHWLGRHGQPAIQRIQFRQRRTFDSGATPTVAQRRRPATLADIDLGALAGRMAAVVEKAAQDDPKALWKQIADLRRDLVTAGVGTADPSVIRRLTKDNDALRRQLAEALSRPAEQVEVPVLAPGEAAALEQAITGLRDIAGSLELSLGRAAAVKPKAAAPPAPRREPERIPADPAAWPRTVADPATGWPVPAPDAPALSKAQRAILTVLAQFPDGRTKRQIGMLAGYSAKGGGFNNALSSMRTSGYINRGEPVRATDEGRAALGTWDPLPEGAALIDHWMGQLSKAAAGALRALLDAYPASLSKAEIAERAGYAADGGGFNNALSQLRTLQLIDGYGDIRADETLAEAMEGSAR